MPKRVEVVTEMTRITVNITKRLVDFVDEMAKEHNTSRSKVISDCLEDLEKKRKQARMEKGYRALAKEHEDFAEMAVGIAAEVLL